MALDAPLGSATYARMFPELPSFEADEQFLHALGRAGGLCDGGAKIIKGARLKVYPGLLHGMCSTHKEQVNNDLRAFIKGEQSAAA